MRTTIVKKARLANNNQSFIESFDTGKIYQSEFIAVGIQVSNARETWRYGGYLSQEFKFVTGGGYANTNKAFNRTQDLLINDVSIINLPNITQSEYRLRFFPPVYFTEVRLQIWEYIGETTNKQVRDLIGYLASTPTELLIDLPNIEAKLDRLLANQQAGISLDFRQIEGKLDALLKCIDCKHVETIPQAKYYLFAKLFNFL